ncbi:MAG: hypothetical protein IAF38_00885 [Bacteroidia bacterium]|nr:hypothetical protein [Bacteroidia bacterium]
METKKQIGIWMDHSVAHIMKPANNAFENSTLKSEFTHNEKMHSLSKNENLMHNKEQHEQAKYYKSIADSIKDYKEVVLFGPTTAKEELANLLKADHHFEHVKIVVKHADKMTENQQHAFVREHFHLA